MPDAGPRLPWARIESVFDAALEQPPESRDAWVARAVEGDPTLEHEVRELLRAHDRHGVLDAPPALLPPVENQSIERELAASLAPTYQLEQLLGEGGMASVFRATHVDTGRAVVVKVLRPEVAVWLGLDRFITEIQICRRLSHPQILPLVDSGVAGGLLYYAMPYLGGETLRAKIARGPIGLGEIGILRDIAAALAHAHGRDVIHRDLKPENVLVVEGRAFLMDFGVGKLRPEHGGRTRTAEGMAIGTPAYMAPEQAAGDPIDARADVFAWGLVALEVFAGRRSRRLDPGLLKTRVPTALTRLIRACLEANPRERPASGQEVLDRFDAAVKRLPRA